MDTAVEAAKLCNSEYVKVIGVKLFMDGVVDAPRQNGSPHPY